MLHALHDMIAEIRRIACGAFDFSTGNVTQQHNDHKLVKAQGCEGKIHGSRNNGNLKAAINT